MRAPHILVVDDQAMVRDALASLLADAGFRVSCAGDGLDALAAVERDPPDLVVSDVAMPRMGGHDLRTALTTRAAPIPTVLMSADTGSLGTAGPLAVPKPVDIGRLMRLLAALLGQSTDDPSMVWDDGPAD